MAMRADRRVPLTRERVLQAAMNLVDEGGIESLSMRKLGLSLGVEAMSLYNHVANKDDLLDGIIDLVLREFELPSVEYDWEAAIRRCAISAHEALLRHRWACSLILSSTRVQPARLEYIESLLRCLRTAGFSAEETYHAYHTIDSHILGFTLWQLGHAMPAGASRIRNKEDLIALAATVLPAFSPDEYPYVLEHGVQHLTEGSHQDEGEFEFGLRLLLDGLRRIGG